MMTVDELLNYWPGNIPFKGSLISEDGCMCAQGQVLHLLGGMSPDELRQTKQSEADRKTAELMGISLSHAVLLRLVNDSQPGAPTCVIREPEKVLGDQAQRVLAFWRHLDRMTADDWQKVDVAEYAAEYAAMNANAVWDAVRTAACRAAGNAVRNAAGRGVGNAVGNAAWASNEIQGAAIMRQRGQSFFFLPMFGFNSPEDIPELMP